MTPATNVLIVGVGGQGVLLAGEALAGVAMAHGLDVKKSDVHGMAQRGGIVYSHVRFGTSVKSPLIEEGQVDALLALEAAEALRWVGSVRPGGLVIADRSEIVPPAACHDRRLWASLYPPLRVDRLQQRDRTVYLIDARGAATSAGAAQAANAVLLGALSQALAFAPHEWQAAIMGLVPSRSIEANLSAFELGRLARPRPRVAPEPTAAPAWRRPRGFAIEVIEPWCKGCDICVRLCPENCLRLNSRGVVEAAAPGTCTGCRICERLCPDFAIEIHEGAIFCG